MFHIALRALRVTFFVLPKKVTKEIAPSAATPLAADGPAHLLASLRIGFVRGDGCGFFSGLIREQTRSEARPEGVYPLCGALRFCENADRRGELFE
jgi:hypothetical protein